jgi:nicotinate-nucleotide adenylyltransferase
MRLGIFGGTFDPVHYGHLLLAECCFEQCRLDSVWFLPSALPPHKTTINTAAAKERVEMLELAIAGHTGFKVCRYEVDRGGVNYTFETLAALREQEPASEFFFLLGGDMFYDLPNWREPQTVCQLAVPVAVHRAGSPEIDFSRLAGIASAERIEEMRAHAVEMPDIGLSSSDIRVRIAAGQSIRYRTPRAVEKYIEAKGLYRV